MKVMGGLCTFCCLSGFQVRQGSMYVQVIDQNMLEKYVCENCEEIRPEDCRKVLVQDMFANASPSDNVDLELKDVTAGLVEKFIAKHKRNPVVWDNLCLIRSAQLQLQMQEEINKQRKAMDIKSKKKKAAALEAERKQKRQQRAQEQQQARKIRDYQRKVLKRKRQQDEQQRKRQQEAVKVQRVALKALKSKSDKEKKKLMQELKDVKAELVAVKKESDRREHANENDKLKVIIDGLRDQLKTVKQQHQVAAAPAPPPLPPRVDTPREVRRPRITPRSHVAPRRVEPPAYETPYNPEMVQLYDPEAPVPYVDPNAPTPPFLRRLHQHRPPTRRQLPFPSPRVPFGTWGKGGGQWHYY